MKMGNEQHIDLLGIDAIEERQAGHSVVAWVDAAVEEDGGGAEGQEVAGAAYFLAGAEWCYGHDVFHFGIVDDRQVVAALLVDI